HVGCRIVIVAFDCVPSRADPFGLDDYPVRAVVLVSNRLSIGSSHPTLQAKPVVRIVSVCGNTVEARSHTYHAAARVICVLRNFAVWPRDLPWLAQAVVVAVGCDGSGRLLDGRHVPELIVVDGPRVRGSGTGTVARH